MPLRGKGDRRPPRENLSRVNLPSGASPSFCGTGGGAERWEVRACTPEGRGGGANLQPCPAFAGEGDQAKPGGGALLSLKNPSTAPRALPLPEKSRRGIWSALTIRPPPSTAPLPPAAKPGCARESVEGPGPKPPKEQPPRNLSGTRDRARKGTLESVLPRPLGIGGGATEGVTRART